MDFVKYSCANMHSSHLAILVSKKSIYITFTLECQPDSLRRASRRFLIDCWDSGTP